MASLMKLLCLIALTLTFVSGGVVIQSHWNHVRLKTLPPSRVDGRAGGKVVLVCSATGSPAPKVSWYKDSLFVSHLDWAVEEVDSSMGETVSRLTIPCMSEREVGVYECRAHAGEQEVSATTEVNMDSSDLEMTPSCTEQNSVAMWRKTLMIEEGANAVLPCRLQNPSLDHQVTWTNSNGETAPAADSRVSLSSNGDLVIKNVVFADMGQYTCTVTGSWGTDSIHTFVYPLAHERNVIPNL